MRLFAKPMRAAPWHGLLVGIVLAVFLSSPVLAAGAAIAKCPISPKPEVPQGQDGAEIQQAIRKASPGGVVLLKGDYEVDETITLLNGLTVCSDTGATLTWVNPRRAGMMFDGARNSRTTIRNLILDGRGIMIMGQGHVIENNLIRNIRGGSDANNRWGERQGVFLPDHGEDVQIRNNLFVNVIDMGVMAYGLVRTVISGNQFQNTTEGIHLWSVRDTLVSKNSGSGFKAMSIEVQGDNHPGLVVEDNVFRDWHKDHLNGTYAMSVVSGKGAVVRRNQIIGSPLWHAGLEVGGDSPQVTANTFVDANIVITDTPDAVIAGNKLTRGRIYKDVNRSPGGTLTIQDNEIIDGPGSAIFADHWWGHDKVIISGNRISTTITRNGADFHAIFAPDVNKQPLVIRDNQIVIRAAPGIKPGLVSCIINGGYMGNLRGTVVEGNSCDGGGVGVFVHSNSLGGHIGVTYRANQLSNLLDTINGDSQGLLAERNTLSKVARDRASFKDR